VNHMDPMAQIISGLPDNGGGQGNGQGGGGGFMQPQPNMFNNMQPPAPQQSQPAIPQYPAYAPPQYPAAPAQPQWQQVTPQPPAPGQMPQGMPQVPQMPVMPQVPVLPSQQPANPMMPSMPLPGLPQLPSNQPSNQPMPQWAQEMMQNIQQIQQGGTGNQPNTFDPTKPWSNENRPKSWDEMRSANEALAEQKAREIVTTTMQQQTQQAQQQQQQVEQANQQIDNTFNRLRLSGYLPPIQNPGNPNDPGKLAERELLGWTLTNGGKTAEDILFAAPSLVQQHQMGRFFDPQSGQMQQRRGQSAAAMAPIAGGMPVMGQMGTPSGPTQRQLAQGGRDLGSLMAMGMDQVQ
jgi:hypothetical protein